MKGTPLEILQLVSDYLHEKDRMEFLNCCNEWYDIGLFRRVRKLWIRNWNFWSSSDLTRKMNRVICNPCDQLALVVTEIYHQSIALSLLQELEFCIYELTCTDNILRQIVSSSSRLIVKRLSILRSNMTTPESYEFLLKVIGCQAFSLSFSDVTVSHILPYLPSINRLSIEQANLLSNLNNHTLSDYSTHLNHLSLYECHISDVSMFGSIRSLELKRCTLNDNDSVVVEQCDTVLDFTLSFQNTRKIEIVVSQGTISFDLTKWKKVEELTLKATSNEFAIDRHSQHNPQNRLPITVRKCYLEKKFVYFVNFTVTADHVLQEIVLSEDQTIHSLESFGLHKVAIVEFNGLDRLFSIEGLGVPKEGKRRNRKVTIRNCHKITDFSSLHHIPIVMIEHCAGFYGGLNHIQNFIFIPDFQSFDFKPRVICYETMEVKVIRELFTIGSKVVMRYLLPEFTLPLPAELISEPFCLHIHSLSLPSLYHITSLEGLERVPYLQLGTCGLPLVRSFLTTARKRFKNQQITLLDIDSRHRYWYELERLHDEFMFDRYDYDYYPLAKKWVWLRRKLIHSYSL